MITQEQADAVIVAAFGEQAVEGGYVLSSPMARTALEAAFGVVPREFPSVECGERDQWFQILSALADAVQPK